MAASTRLTIQDVQAELRQVNDWYPLGIALGIESFQLKAIEDVHRHNPGRCMLEVIDFWLKNGREVSWVGLAEALRSIGKYSQLADALMKKGVPNGGDFAKMEQEPAPRTDSMSSPSSSASSASATDIHEWAANQTRPTKCKGISIDKALLLDQTYDIKLKFNELITIVQNTLIRIGVKVKDMVSYLEGIPAFNSSCRSLFEGEIADLRTKPDLIEVFQTIKLYCSWFNHSLIGSIIRVYCSDDENVAKAHRDFRSQLKKYCMLRVCECKPSSKWLNGRKQSSKHITMKVDQRWDSITVGQLQEVTSNVAKILELNKHTLYLQRVEEGCVQVTFLVPKFVAEARFLISPQMREHLQSVQVHWRNYTYSREEKAAVCSGEVLRQIPKELEKYSESLQRLDLSSSKLCSLRGLARFSRLEYLILDNNELTDECLELPCLPHLQTLTLNNNKISHLKYLLENLTKSCPRICYLSLLCNDACPYAKDEEYQRYRALNLKTVIYVKKYDVIRELPNLAFLDCREVTPQERLAVKGSNCDHLMRSTATYPEAQSLTVPQTRSSTDTESEG